MFDFIFGEIPSGVTEWLHFILIIVLFRGVFSKWLGIKIVKYVLSPLTKMALKRLINTERQLAIWLHYRNRALQQGHNHKNPLICPDGNCQLFKK